MKIISLLMDYLKEPMGVETMPQFGWVVQAEGRNRVQTAYQLQIARDEAFGEICHDSGIVSSDESAHVRIDGVSLQPFTRYYARVKVWSGAESTDWFKASFVTGQTNRVWHADLISAESEGDWGCSKGTYLRGEICLTGQVKEAYIGATAHGLYHLYLNGQKVGEDQLAPGWTSYHHQLCYQTYDVSSLLAPGPNVLGAHVGAGWYKGMMGFIHERNNYGRQTAFLAELTVRYTDGRTETFGTDQGWLGCDSPVTFSEIYDGERYDARLEQPGWSCPGFKPAFGPARAEKAAPARDLFENPHTEEEKEDLRRVARAYQPKDCGWRPVRVLPQDDSVLTPQPGCRVRVEQRLPVKQIIKTPQGDTVLDFGQNLTGWVTFRVNAHAGDLVHIRCFETLDAGGNYYFDNLRGALNEIRYTCREGEQTYMELFSFQGFRYAKLESWPGRAAPEDFKACVVFSDMAQTGSFSCSDPLVNRLEQNIEWSLRGNFLDIPTDCPQRDERMGWTGDAQIFCRTATFLRNTWPFFSKWLKDVAFDQTAEGGVAHIVPNTLAYFPITDWLLGQGIDSAAAWADVAVINPWTLYQAYGDKRILSQQFDSMKKWIDFMRAHARDYIWNYKLQFGDWVALDAQEGSYYGATPNDLTCTAYFAYSTGLFVKTCRALGREDMAREYQELHDKIVERFRKAFLDQDGVMRIQTQTAHIVALYFDLVPEKGRQGTVNGLRKLIEKSGGHLVTGFVGTPYITHALSRNGCAADAYDLLLRQDFPSWLYEVKAGATTIWEHWDGLKPDGTMWSPDMNSFNHYAYGAVGEWLYRVAAGIEIDESCPGYKHLLVCPQTTDRLTWVQAGYDSVYGTVKTRWERHKNCVTLHVTVPFNTTASVLLEQGAGEAGGDCPFERDDNGRYRADVGSGSWRFTYTLI